MGEAKNGLSPKVVEIRKSKGTNLDVDYMGTVSKVSRDMKNQKE